MNLKSMARQVETIEYVRRLKQFTDHSAAIAANQSPAFKPGDESLL